MKVGIFEKLRTIGIYASDTSFFKFTSSPYTTVSGGFCLVESVYGIDASGVFDGNPNTAWASEYDRPDTEEKYVMVEFLKSPLFIESYKYTSSCCTSTELKVEGSNDGRTFFELDNRITNQEDFTNKTFHCKHPSYTKFVKISGPITVRLHIGAIELYGTFDYKCSTFYKQRTFNQIFIQILLLLS